MGRPRGSKNKDNGSGPRVTKHDNIAKEPMTDEQRRALTDSWAGEYEAALGRKKECDAEFKNVCKKAKGEGVFLADIKAYLAAETPEGQDKLREDAERLERIARWQNFKLDHQPSFFDDQTGETGADSLA